MTEAAPTVPSGDVFDLQGFEWLKDKVDMNPDGSPIDQGTPQPEPQPQPQPQPAAPAPATPAEPQAPAPVPAPAPTPIDPALAPTQAQPEPAAPTEPGVQTPPAGDDKLWAKKYRSPEDLERGYLEAQGGLTRAYQERAEDRRRIDSLETTLKQLAPMVERTMVASDPEMAERLAMEQQLRPMVEQQVAPIRDQFQAAQQQAYEQATVQQFYASHGDVTPYSAEDQAVRTVMEGLDLNLSPEGLEVAYQAAKDPNLYRVLKANPAFVDSDEGVSLARTLAAIPDPAAVQAAATSGQPAPVAGQPQPQPQAQAPAQASKAAAFTEPATSGSPTQGAPGPQAQDPWGEAVAAYRAAHADSVFFQ